MKARQYDETLKTPTIRSPHALNTEAPKPLDRPRPLNPQPYILKPDTPRLDYARLLPDNWEWLGRGAPERISSSVSGILGSPMLPGAIQITWRSREDKEEAERQRTDTCKADGTQRIGPMNKFAKVMLGVTCYVMVCSNGYGMFQRDSMVAILGVCQDSCRCG